MDTCIHIRLSLHSIYGATDSEFDCACAVGAKFMCVSNQHHEEVLARPAKLRDIHFETKKKREENRTWPF